MVSNIGLFQHISAISFRVWDTLYAINNGGPGAINDYMGSVKSIILHLIKSVKTHPYIIINDSVFTTYPSLTQRECLATRKWGWKCENDFFFGTSGSTFSSTS